MTNRRSFLALLAGVFALPKIPVEAKAGEAIHLGAVINSPTGQDWWFLENVEGVGAILHHRTWHRASDIAYIGTDTVYSTADLIREITSPAFWPFPCPPRMVEKIKHRASIEWCPSLGWGRDWIWGWRKLPPHETLEEIMTEYVLGRWSRLCYLPK